MNTKKSNIRPILRVSYDELLYITGALDACLFMDAVVKEERKLVEVLLFKILDFLTDAIEKGYYKEDISVVPN